MGETLGIVLKENEEARAAFEEARHLLNGVRVLVEDREVEGLGSIDDVEVVGADVMAREASMLMVFGGDGTMIHAASLVTDRVVPLLGINLGRIGFLTDVARDEIARAVPMALEGKLPFVDRMRLDCSLRRDGKEVARSCVLNDAVVNQKAMARIAMFRIMLSGEHVTTVRADGVIAATPTGSTAYSMAAGGSILMPGLEAIAVTPISPHGLSQRPLVVVPEGELVIKLVSDSSVFATFDGQEGYEFRPGDELSVRPAKNPARLFTVPWRSYFETLRYKLRWGET